MHPDASLADILPECRFEDRLAGKALALQDPEACITACDPSQLDDAFARIQAAQRQGRWIVLLLDYELGEWLDPALAPQDATAPRPADAVQASDNDTPADTAPAGHVPVSPAPQPRLTAWVFRRAVHETPWTDTAAPGMSPSSQSPHQADLQVDRLQQGFVASASVSQPSQQSRHQPAPLPPAQTAHHTGPQTLRLDSRPGIHPDSYRANIESLRDDMARGEFYQANYTFPIHVTAQGDLAQLYRRIANHHPSAHAVWFRDPRRTILSFSPELFVARQGSRLTVRPMKGTAPRDADPAQDQRNANTLRTSQKDRAENLMIVDLLRNDLGRIATPGSVKVEALFSLERYPSVWTMTSTITAQAPQCNLRDILQALFPCGSITGAPKIAAMRRLRQIEPQPRDIYCGSIGWLAPDGDFSLNVAIRTLEFPDPAASRESATRTPDTADGGVQMADGVPAGNTSTDAVPSAANAPTDTPATPPIHLGKFGVGGGIVHDSRPDMEWQECLWKARLLTLPGMGVGPVTAHDTVALDSVQLIETLRIEPGRRIPLLDGHRARLRQACRTLGHAWPATLDQAITQHIADLDPNATHRLRILVSRDGSCDLQSNPLPPTLAPVRVLLAGKPLAADPAWLGLKATHRPWYAQPTAWLQTHPDIFDILYCNDRDEVCEGSRSNVYIRDIDGNWLTPPPHCGLLPGVQRQALLDQGLVREAVISRAQLQQASQIRVSNALRGWLDAVLVDDGNPPDA